MDTKKLSDCTICVVGISRRQNEMMASFLAGTTDAHCVVGEEDYGIPAFSCGDHSQPRIILWNCQDGGVECLSEYNSRRENILKEDIVLFLDMRSGLGIEEDAIDLGVRGFFYESDPLEKLPRCLEVLLTGQLWVSRKILANAVWQQRVSNKVADLLSQRETEILNCILIGASNEDIAERLSISPNTTRSHMSNIFRKLNVPNKLQAIRWARQNLYHQGRRSGGALRS